ncbi:hypothetical protein [Nonomuraea sp. NPDC049400]|uniref:hypothetical protein n=1 Tax=Nonomuraea sp. NPDC049400 TaxID=3364352 RepID=UPI00378E11FC
MIANITPPSQQGNGGPGNGGCNGQGAIHGLNPVTAKVSESREEETTMQMYRHPIIVGAAFAAIVALWPAGAQASPIPSSGTQATVTEEPPDGTPYQRGYDRGRSEGYERGEARALNYCARDPFLPWPTVSQDAYGVGYDEAFQLSYGRGFEDGYAKHCRPA